MAASTGAASLAPSDEPQDWEEGSCGSAPLLPHPTPAAAAVATARAVSRRRHLLWGASVALTVGTIAVAATLAAARSLGGALVPSHADSVQGGFTAALSVKQEQYSGGAGFVSSDTAWASAGDPTMGGAAATVAPATYGTFGSGADTTVAQASWGSSSGADTTAAPVFYGAASTAAPAAWGAASTAAPAAWGVASTAAASAAPGAASMDASAAYGAATAAAPTSYSASSSFASDYGSVGDALTAPPGVYSTSSSFASTYGSVGAPVTTSRAAIYTGGAPGGAGSPAAAAPAAAASVAGGPSMYCFALTMSFGNEVKLLQYQLQARVSLFSCQEYQVFSNVSFTLGPDSARGGAPLQVSPIGISMKVPHGGRWGTALNTDVFVRLWQVVAKEGRWRNHEWSCKLDADAVFLPARLSAMLRRLPNPGAKYLNNCKWGMHGPIEVVSRGALQIFFSRMQSCEQIREDAMQWQPVHWNAKMLRYTGTDKDHSFGEDQYLRRCLRLLKVTQVNEYKLLDELACGGDPKHTGCIGNYVTYHPFKEVDQYKTCLLYTRVASATLTS
uniref:Uncharacterized protein n=1 Tax=Alexandrium monilatum TaxID=311494 RepID=A0A7S4WGQ7_9DINO